MDALHNAGYVPELVVTAPDRPAGRGHQLQQPPAKVWAEQRSIPVAQPEKIDDTFIAMHRDTFEKCDVFLVVAYGVILPKSFIELPKHKTLNVHFSLLPRWRGASPVESAILAGDTETGCAIQVMRPKLDTGPVVALETTAIGENETAPELRERLGDIGASLLVRTLPEYTAGTLETHEQDEILATYARKMTKEDGDITNDDDLIRWRKFRAYYDWPGTYFFTKRNNKSIRVKVASARFANNTFVIDEVVPEGRKRMKYEDFTRADS